MGAPVQGGINAVFRQAGLIPQAPGAASGPPPMPPPTVAKALQPSGAAGQAVAGNAAGLSSTVLTGPLGTGAGVNYAGKTLTGQ